MTNEDEDKLVTAVGNALRETAEIKPLRLADRPLPEQVARFESLGASLREIIRAKGTAIKAEYDRRMVEAAIEYDSAVASAAKARAETVSRIERETRDKLAEIDALVARLP